MSTGQPDGVIPREEEPFRSLRNPRPTGFQSWNVDRHGAAFCGFRQTWAR